MDRVLLGATRPALLFGVPIVPFVLVEGCTGLTALWVFLVINGFAALVIGSVGLLALFFMRAVTRRDDQRLHQLGLRLRLRAVERAWGNQRYWQCASRGALTYRHH